MQFACVVFVAELEAAREQLVEMLIALREVYALRVGDFRHGLVQRLAGEGGVLALQKGAENGPVHHLARTKRRILPQLLPRMMRVPFSLQPLNRCLLEEVFAGMQQLHGHAGLVVGARAQVKESGGEKLPGGGRYYTR